MPRASAPVRRRRPSSAVSALRVVVAIMAAAALLAIMASSMRCFVVSAFVNQRTAAFAATGRWASSARRRGNDVGGAVRALSMVRNRGLEVREEGATPLPGGMTLYIKAGPDGTSPGDCPFAHYVRTVLREKSLGYDLRPSAFETKPRWLVDCCDGKMPALRHGRECYVEGDVIARYLDFFFRDPPLSASSRRATGEADEVAEGFFPCVARYLKHAPDGDAEDGELREKLEAALMKLEDHLDGEGRSGPYLVGDKEDFSLADASLAPKLYHMEVGVDEFKDGAVDFGAKFPKVRAYMDAVFERPSFKEASYPRETIVWGWGTARGELG